MKNKSPSFKFYPDNFMGATYFFTDAQVGKYIRLLCLQFQHRRLTEDNMMAVCKKYDKDIFDKFTKDENGLYYNKRLEHEIAKSKNYSKSRSENRRNKDTYDEDMKNISTTHDEDVKNTPVYDIAICNMNNEIEIINYLNGVCGTKFKTNAKSTLSHINARLNDGYTVEDFKTVIDKKYRDWSGDKKMVGYLRPSTLFAPKNFENYLNQLEKPKESSFMDLDVGG